MDQFRIDFGSQTGRTFRLDFGQDRDPVKNFAQFGTQNRTRTGSDFLKAAKKVLFYCDKIKENQKSTFFNNKHFFKA